MEDVDPLNISPIDALPTTEYDTSDVADNDQPCLAIIEFPDSNYYMKNPSLVIGRNTLAERYFRNDPDVWVDGKQVRMGAGKRKKELETDYSESGYDSYHESGYDSERLTAAGGIGGPQAHATRENSEGLEEDFVYVHPPADVHDADVVHFTSISKEHLRIALIENVGWMCTVLGRNGAYLNGEYLKQWDEAYLEDKDSLTIASLPMTFHLSDQIENQRRYSSSERSVESDIAFTQNLPHPGRSESSSLEEDLEDNDGEVGDDEDQNKETYDGTAKAKPNVRRKIITASRKDLTEKPAKRELDPKKNSAQVPEHQPTKRKGPGRPPADGIMSKRERKEREKAAKLGIKYGDELPRTKEKPRKKCEGNGEDKELEKIARKPKKRKRPDEDEGEETEQQGSLGALDAGEEDKAPPPPRSPSPKKEDYPPERLLKPEMTYQHMLFYVLSESQTPMALPQIYQDMKKRWPYFKFTVESHGWESSVRHNLQSNQCFMRAGKAGKGHLWTMNPDVPFEPRSRRTEPSVQQTGTYYTTTNYNNHLSGYATQSGTHGQLPYNGRPSQGPIYPQYTTSPPSQPLTIKGGNNTVASSRSYYSSPNYSAPFPTNLTSSQPHPTSSDSPLHARESSSSVYGAPPRPHASSAQPNHSGKTASQPNCNNSSQTPVFSNVPQTIPSTTLSVSNSSTNGSAAVAYSQPAQQHVASIQSNRSVSSSWNGVRRMTGYEQLYRGLVPDVFQNFRSQLKKLASSSEEATRGDQPAGKAIDWIMRNPYSEEGFFEGRADIDSSTKGIIKILINMLKVDEKGGKRPGTPQQATNSVASHASAPHHMSQPLQQPTQAQSPAVPHHLTPSPGGGPQPQPDATTGDSSFIKDSN